MLAILRLLDARLPHIGVMDISLRWKRGAAPSERMLRDLLNSKGLKAVRIGHVMSPDCEIHEHLLKVKGPMPMDVDALVAQLCGHEGLSGFSVLPRDE